MKLTVNGDDRDVPPDTTVRSLIESLGLGKAVVAVEVNRKLIQRQNHESTVLKEGDQVEVVTLVGGG